MVVVCCTPHVDRNSTWRCRRLDHTSESRVDQASVLNSEIIDGQVLLESLKLGRPWTRPGEGMDRAGLAPTFRFIIGRAPLAGSSSSSSASRGRTGIGRRWSCVHASAWNSSDLQGPWSRSCRRRNSAVCCKLPATLPREKLDRTAHRILARLQSGFFLWG